MFYRFEQLLQTQITVYVENQLLSNFGDIVKFVQSVDSLLSNAEETDDSSAIPPGIDLAEMEAVVMMILSFSQFPFDDYLKISII